MQPRLEEFIASPRRALITLSVPVVIAAVVQTFYNIVDTIYVGHIGSEALAAISVAWPFFVVLVSVSQGLNSGIASRISRYLGEKRKKLAENAALHGLIMAFLSSMALILLGLPSLGWLLSMGGAEGNVLDMAHDYMSLILLGSLFMFTVFAINAIFSSQGDTKTPMKVNVSSLLMNIILTPFFIFYLGFGISGAAISTVISMSFALMLSIYYLRKDSYLDLRPQRFSYKKKIVSEIIKVGLPTTAMILVMSVYVIFLNKAMSYFSVDHLAAFGVVSRLESVAVLPVMGISVGTMTLVGMFYGAKRFELMKKISIFAIGVGAALTIFVGAVFFVLASPIIAIFTSDADVIQLGIPYLRIDVLTLPAIAVMLIFSRIMQGLGKGYPGLVVNFLRVFGVIVPLSYIAVFMFGFDYLSIAWSMVAGGIVAIITSLIWLTFQIRRCTRHDT